MRSEDGKISHTCGLVKSTCENVSAGFLSSQASLLTSSPTVPHDHQVPDTLALCFLRLAKVATTFAPAVLANGLTLPIGFP
jgi:hypothetical protein